jgi:S-adenosylmethionine-diacylglycerol 3-amino-3-carboxypropyl transferase
LKTFYSRLSYSFGNEDHATEATALNIKPTDTIACITASGDRPLNLLAQTCEKIYSIDANPIQNYLLHLKCAALNQLEIDEYLTFLGVKKSDKKFPFSHTILESLPISAKNYWKENRYLIDKGVIYQGAVERLCTFASNIFKFLFRKQIEKLMNFDSIHEQQAYVAPFFEKKLPLKALKLFLNPIFTKRILKDPGLYAHLKDGRHPANFIHEKFKKSLNTHLCKESILLSLVLNGAVKEEAFGPYLREEGIKKIKEQLDKLTIIDSNIIDFLESLPAQSIDCFSFSDIASYMDKDTFNRLLKAMIRAAKPGARFCIRQFMSSHPIDPDISEKLLRNPGLEEELASEDRCFLYSFMTGTILD